MNIVAEREWREASDMRRSSLSLAGILAVAAVLRFWGLGAGIPHAVEPGEDALVGRAVHMMRTGDFDPRSFEQPGFYAHVQLGAATLRFLAGATRGAWRSVDQPSVDDFLVWGRAVSALFGTLTVLVLFHTAMRWGSRYALLAAGLLTVLPLHVRASHVVAPEIPLTFFVALAFLLSLQALEAERPPAFAAAGAAAGLATATQYAGAMALLLPLVAVAMVPANRGVRVKALAAAFAGAAAAFSVAAPYTWLNLPGFLNGAARVAAASWSGDPAPDAGWYYLGQLRLAFHWPALILLLPGAVLGVLRALRGPGRPRWTMVVGFPAVYLWFLASLSLLNVRLLLPAIPMLCLLVAVAVVSGVSLLRRFDIPRAMRTALIAGGTVAALLPPAVDSFLSNRRSSRPTTAALAHAWIVANVPQGSTLVLEDGAPRLPERYRVERLPRLIERDREEYLAHRTDYLVASSPFARALTASHERPAEYSAYMHLLEQSREVARFTPDADRAGPEIRVFALR